MVEKLYVTRGGKRAGPYSPAQLRAFASAGQILLTDTIWKEGMSHAVVATKVKNLFPAPAAPAVSPDAVAPEADAAPPSPPPSDGLLPLSPGPVAESDSPPPAAETFASTKEAGPAAATALVVPLADLPVEPGPAEEPSLQPEVAPKKPPPPPEQQKKRRAIAIRGAIIASQDGFTVYFRKKCTHCGFEASSRSSMPIGMGVFRATYFCTKCRKVRDVQLQGVVQ